MSRDPIANDNTAEALGVRQEDVDHVKSLLWDLLEEFIEDDIPHASVVMAMAEVLGEYVPGEPFAYRKDANEGELRSGLMDLTLARGIIREQIREYNDKLRIIEAQRIASKV